MGATGPAGIEHLRRRTGSYTGLGVKRSYCQVWCTRVMMSGGLPADLSLIDTVDEVDTGDDVGKLSEAA